MTLKSGLLLPAIFSAAVLTACGGGSGGSSSGGGVTPPSGNTNSPPRFTSATSFSFDENQVVSFTLTVADSDGDTVTITDDANGDGSLFTLNATTGVVTANTSNGVFNFEAPQDVDGNNVYEQDITLSDGTASVTQTIRVTIGNVIEPPVYNGLTDYEFNENSISGFAIGVTDPDSRTLDINLTGPDADDFTVENLSISLVENFNFEAPTDADVNNVYEITLSIANNEATIEEDLTITVKDVNEPPLCSQGDNVRFAENSTGDIYSFTVSDPEGDPHDFAADITVNAESAFTESLSFDSSTGTVRVDLPINFEAVRTKTGSVSTSYGGTACNMDFELTDVEGRVSSGIRILGNIVKTNSIGDIDADGLTDVWMAESGSQPAGYVIYSQTLNGLMPNGELALNATTPPAEAIKITANAINGVDDDQQILSARHIGDIDGDGFEEVLLGVEATDVNTSRPIAYLVWGATLRNNTTGTLELDDMDSSEGLILTRPDISESFMGFTAGDVDGDNLDDIILGVPAGFGTSNANEGIYVIFGSYLNASKSADNFNMDSTARDEILRLSYDAFAYENLGANLTTIADIDGDGTDELMAEYDVGVASILGKDILTAKGGTDPDFIVTEEIQTFRPLVDFNHVPFDVEGDGEDDLLFSSVSDDMAQLEPGATLDGNRVRTGEKVVASNVRVSPVTLSGLGDLNGDGQDEFAIGAFRQNEPLNTVNIISGAAFTMTPIFTGFNMDTISPGEGLIIEGISPLFELNGELVRTDDYDQDGLNELVIISPVNNQAYILRGSDLRNAMASGSVDLDLNPLINDE